MIDKSATITISNGGTTAMLNRNNGQLFSLMRGGVEAMWDGASPAKFVPFKGWPNNSELVMFPIVGAAPEGKLTIRGKQFEVAARHGPSRYLPWEITGTGENIVIMRQSYRGNTEVVAPGKGRSILPYSHELEKTYKLDKDGSLSFELAVKNTSDEVLPFQVGWHPTFRVPKDLTGENPPRLSVSAVPAVPDAVTLENIRLAEGNVMLFEESTAILYKSGEFNLFFSHRFGNTLVWNKGDGFLGIEPISSVPFGRMNRANTDMARLDKLARLDPGQSMKFDARIGIYPRS
jgi:galactose mutarotase-like enzyme